MKRYKIISGQNDGRLHDIAALQAMCSNREILPSTCLQEEDTEHTLRAWEIEQLKPYLRPIAGGNSGGSPSLDMIIGLVVMALGLVAFGMGIDAMGGLDSASAKFGYVLILVVGNASVVLAGFGIMRSKFYGFVLGAILLGLKSFTGGMGMTGDFMGALLYSIGFLVMVFCILRMVGFFGEKPVSDASW